MYYLTLFLSKIGKMSRNLSSAAVVIGALRVKLYMSTANDFQQCGILTSVDSVEPVQPSLKLRNSISCSVSVQILLQDGQSRDTQLVISHFYEGFLIDSM